MLSLARRVWLVMLISVVIALSGSIPARANADYSVSHVPLVSTNGVDSMGSLIVSLNNLPGCDAPIGNNQDHQFIMKLPADYVIKSTTANIIYPHSALVETFIQRIGDNQILVELYATDLIEEVKIAIDIQTYIPPSASEAINASIIAQPGSVFNDGIVQIARTGFGLVTVQVKDPIRLTSAGGEGLEMYFYESQANALREGPGSMSLKLPPGFEWEEPSPGDFICQTSGCSDGNAFYIEKVNSQTLKFDKYRSSDRAYSWKLIANIGVDKSAASYGDVIITIDGTSRIHPKNIVIGEYLDLNDGTDEKPVVNPASVDGYFMVGSKEYRVNGKVKTMDTAPYIKGNRTYVPMRYLGDILGAEVAWDDTARTVTLTKGDTTVVFTCYC